MDFRRLTENDAELYHKIRLEALEREPRAFTESAAEHHRLTSETIRNRLDVSHDNFVLGAFDDKQLIGMAGFFRLPESKTSHRGHIWGVYIGSHHRARGVGRAMMEELLRLLKSLPNLEQVSLGVSTSNLAAKSLYESLGFEIYGSEKHALKIGEEYVDEDLMVLYFR